VYSLSNFQRLENLTRLKVRATLATPQEEKAADVTSVGFYSAGVLSEEGAAARQVAP
jgi:hypothetical protein